MKLLVFGHLVLSKSNKYLDMYILCTKSNKYLDMYILCTKSNKYLDMYILCDSTWRTLVTIITQFKPNTAREIQFSTPEILDSKISLFKLQTVDNFSNSYVIRYILVQ